MKKVSLQFLKKVGSNIKSKRKKKGLSMQELGYYIGLSRMQVFRLEQGANITLLTLLKISIALNTPMAELLIFRKTTKEDLEWLVDNNKANRKKAT
jgi:transcriptional regulator with XRE-family HTH domain